MNNLEYKILYSRNLPHYQPEYGIFAITFRLAFSLPKNILETLKTEKKEFARISSKLKGKELNIYKNEFERTYFEKFDNFLDNYSKSPLWLSMYSIADEVKGSLNFIDKKMYDLIAYCIMPNHVHMITNPYRKKKTISIHWQKLCIR